MELIINIDGGSRGNPGPGASAWVIKNTKGIFLAKEGLFFKECTNNQAEFTALKMALEKSLTLGGTNLSIRSDSLLLVKQYLGEYKIKNPQLQIIMAEIKKVACKFKRIDIKHVPREQNKEADLMANITMDSALKNKYADGTILTTPDMKKQQEKPTQTEPAPQAGKSVIKKSDAENKKPAAKIVAAKKTNTKPKETPIQLELFDLNN